MSFLVDNALSPRVAADLCDLGHDAIHVGDVGRARSPDTDIFDFAAHDRRVIVSADTDFSAILAMRRNRRPSVVQLRDGTERVPELQAPLIHRWSTADARALAAGAVLTIEFGRCRVRPLPIARSYARRR